MRVVFHGRRASTVVGPGGLLLLALGWLYFWPVRLGWWLARSWWEARQNRRRPPAPVVPLRPRAGWPDDAPPLSGSERLR